MTTIVWFRRDLRTRDNPALSAAAMLGEPVLPVFILEDDDQSGQRPLGGASRWWLHQSLLALRQSLGALVLLRGDPRVVLQDLAQRTKPTAIYWNRRYEPSAIRRDCELKSHLRQTGVEVLSFNASLLHEPWKISNGSRKPFKVFTPYCRAVRARETSLPLPRPSLSVIKDESFSDDLNDWALLPQNRNWAAGWHDLWAPGEETAIAQFAKFTEQTLASYSTKRDQPGASGTSKLSPHLHWGEISSRQLWAALTQHSADLETQTSVEKFRDELIWREFCYYLLYHFPHLAERNWRKEFDAYPWRESTADLKAWQRGLTGYPIVDAGMRELWSTGWMHNRVRMVVGSFLVKHLRIHWRHGEAWFWETLVDADLANNAAGWQWVTGSGADASPYFRIFNPVVQGQKFDPNGDYVRRWCPELKGLPNNVIHDPFKADTDVLFRAGITLGVTYPAPMVNHNAARIAALAGYEHVRAAKALMR
jgi:deoxyribodipyrimidine photo-lyase